MPESWHVQHVAVPTCRVKPVSLLHVCIQHSTLSGMT